MLFAQMPWATVGRPSIAYGILSRVSAAERWSSRSRYLNFSLRNALGSDVYNAFADRRELYGLSEHLFAADLFGAKTLNSDDFLSRIAEGLRDVLGAQAWGRKIGDVSFLRDLRDETLPSFLDEALSEVSAEEPSVVGFTTTFNQVMASLALGARIKRADARVQVVLGGASVDGQMGIEYHRALNDIIDHVFLGEAEESFAQYLRSLAVGACDESIEGVTRFADGGVGQARSIKLRNLSDSPRPDYDDYFGDLRDANSGSAELIAVESLPFESSRGCWWGERNHCVFCGINDDLMNFRAKDVDRVVEDLLALSERYKVTDFAATDWIISKWHCDTLFQQLRDRDLDLSIFYEVRPMMTKAQVGAMRQAGVVQVQPGVESFSTPLLKLMRKYTTGIRQVQFIRWCAEAKIDPCYNILAGIPGDRPEWYLEMAQLLPHICHLPPPGQDVCFVELHRFAPLYEDRGAFGIDDYSARPDYLANFPEGLLDPMKIAYFFDHRASQATDPKEYLQPLSGALRSWLEAYRSPSRPAFTYSLGPGFLTVVDARGQDTRTLTLTDVHHDIALICDQATPRSTLRKVIGSRSQRKLEQAEIDAAVDELLEIDLLMEEGEHLLTLPIGTTFRTTDRLMGRLLS